MSIPSSLFDLSRITNGNMHLDECDRSCIEDATRLASQHGSSTLLWAFMIRLSNEKDPNAALPSTQPLCDASPPSKRVSPSSQHATRQPTPTERDEYGNNDTREQSLSSTENDITPSEPTPIPIRPPKKTKPKLKDPNQPRQPPPAYIRYQNDVREFVKGQFPGITQRESVQEMARMWKALPEEEREVYKMYAKAQRDLWMEEVKVYRQSAAAATRIRPLETSTESDWPSKRPREGPSPYEPTTEEDIIDID
ncbi:hypothetical protein RSOLAG22IIIB_07305 [Rhizoctonia solani]|uniref:HMG box domain-containing protein n=1 Tax=Rhizoctonia solani TaxID=456999 RepID=A0A0K6FM68_9AGAM|nr:hypothetical protein RSOLAG22IIIB_07305 [Rhizoctonia solani]